MSGPLYRTAPPFVETQGDIVGKVAADLGVILDEDQQWGLDQIFGEDEEGLPSSPEFCVVGPRQTTGKSVGLEVAAIADVFLMGAPLHIWTAHEFKTSRKSYLRMKGWLSGNPDYASRCDFRDSHGEESINLDTGESIEFHARSGGSGRGFTTSRLTLDEWLFGQPGDLGALVPTGVTIPDFQVRYASSAGKVGSAALRTLRKRGRAGDPTLAYIEHGAPRTKCRTGERCGHDLDDDGCALNDRALWRQASPGVRSGRVPMRALEIQRRILAGAPLEFAREFLSWWEDPPSEDGDGIDFGKWSRLLDASAERGRRVAFGIATAPDRSWSAIAVAWRRPDGDVQVMLAGDDETTGYRPGAAWVPDRIAELRRKWHGRVLVNTAARDLAPKTAARELSEAQQARAHNALDDAVERGTVHHGGDAALNTAVRAGRWRRVGSTRVLDRSGDVDICPVDAAALALYGVASGRSSSQIW